MGDGLTHCRMNKFLSAAPLGVTCCFPLPTECMPESFLYKDTCHQSCPSHFYADAQHCVPCHEDCLECSGPSMDDCDLCAEASLVLYNGQCLEECPEGTYFEKESKVCKGKDFRVHGRAPHPREPTWDDVFLLSRFWGLRRSIPVPELWCQLFPSSLRKHILNLLQFMIYFK